MLARLGLGLSAAGGLATALGFGLGMGLRLRLRLGMRCRSRTTRRSGGGHSGSARTLGNVRFSWGRRALLDSRRGPYLRADLRRHGLFRPGLGVGRNLMFALSWRRDRACVSTLLRRVLSGKLRCARLRGFGRRGVVRVGFDLVTAGLRRFLKASLLLSGRLNMALLGGLSFLRSGLGLDSAFTAVEAHPAGLRPNG